MLNIYNNKNRQEADKQQSQPVVQGDFSSGKVKVNIPQFEDPTQEFTSKELKWSFWYIQHKALLYRVGLISLVLINIGFFVFSIWKWGAYLWGIEAHRRLEQGLAASVNYTGIHSHFGAQPVQVLNTNVFSSSQSKTDIVAELLNPNKQFLVTFDYYFAIGDQKTPSQAGFLLPGESRPVAYLGLEADFIGSPGIVLENIKYRRISNRLTVDPLGWQTYRLNFQATEFVFLQSLAQEGNNPDAVQFKLTNASPYSYVDVDFYVALLQDGQTVGILPLHIDVINSLETKNIDLRSFVPKSISAITLYPIINVYNEDVFAN